MKKEKRPRFLKGIQARIAAVLATVLFLVLAVNVFVFSQSHTMVQRINDVFSSNSTIIQLSDTLESAQDSLYGYLSTRSSSSLEDFYRYEQELRDQTADLNHQIVDNELLMLERNISLMTDSYLSYAEDAVQGRRGRDVEEYRREYARAASIYEYINSYIYTLNSRLFSQNSGNYQELLRTTETMERLCLAFIVAVCVFAIFIALTLVRSMIRPLRDLAGAAYRVADGDFSVDVKESGREDEVGVVTNAFHRMLVSIRAYIERQRDSLEKEAAMKENELAMEAHLKEAQLKFLQSQINPHFLFNSLNAASQLAMMEDADRTGEFLSRMADFFRYNVKKTGGDATVSEELESVGNYIYILNVRFSGDIHYVQHVDENVDARNIIMPSMILQPIVENAVQHGIHDDHENGIITLTAEMSQGGENETGADCVRVTVSDNGAGMTSEQIHAVMSAGKSGHMHSDAAGDQTENGAAGVALANVISRLELYYGMENLFSIWSDGPGCGTEVSILLPLPGAWARAEKR